MGTTVEKLRQAIASVEASRTALGVNSDRLIDLAWSVMILRPEQRIEVLEAENARLREALRPFADVKCLARSDLMKPINPKLDSFTPLTLTITKGQLLEAMLALSSSPRQD